MAFAIREANPGDAPAIVRHRRAMFEELGCGSPAVIEKLLETFETGLVDLMRRGAVRGWMAIDESGMAVGSAGVRIRGWGARSRDVAGKEGYVVGVYMEPASRGRGLGRRLTEHVMIWSRENNLARVILHPSHKACAMYAAMGFVPEGDAYIWTP